MKRDRAAARAPTRTRPRRMSSSQSAGRSRRASSSSRLEVTDRIGVSELLSSWPSTRIRRCQACRSSSRSARLRSESTSRSTGRPPCRTVPWRTSKRPDAGAARGPPPAAAPGQDASDRPSSSAPRPRRRSDGTAEQALARAVGQPQLALGVEGEDGDVDLGHDLAQERGRFQRAQPLLAQRGGEGVHLHEGEVQRVLACRRCGRGTRSPPRAARRGGSRGSAAAATTASAQRRRACPSASSDDARAPPSSARAATAAPRTTRRAAAATAGSTAPRAMQDHPPRVGEPPPAPRALHASAVIGAA